MRRLLTLALFLAFILQVHAWEMKDVAGYWNSPRHSYLYKPDGTWTMLPEEPGVTSGKWKVEGDILSTGEGTSATFKITKLTADEIVYVGISGALDGNTFRMERSNPAPKAAPSVVGITDEQIRRAQADVDNEAAVAYGGKVGKLDAIFVLEIAGGQVVGYYYHPARDKNLRYLLRGTNPEGVLVLQEFTRASDGKEIHTASCRLTKAVSESRISWSGIMNNTDGRSLPLHLSRPR